MSKPIDPTPPTHGWTPERKALFLDRLAVHGNARAACRNVGMSAEGAYKLRRRDPLFARAWAAAVVLGRDNSIEALAERALDGVEEPIYYRGELIGTRRRYDTRLLLAHLARLDHLADEERAGADAGSFDELVAAVARGDDETELAVPRADIIEQAASMAQERLRDEEMDAYFDALQAGSEEEIPWDHEVDEDFKHELERRCEDLAERARAAAAEGWDSRRAKAIATVDALSAQPPAIAAGLAVGQVRLGEVAGVTRSKKRGGRSFPCTLSTVSTSALARTLAEPPPTWVTTPRSPLTAPRRIGL